MVPYPYTTGDDDTLQCPCCRVPRNDVVAHPPSAGPTACKRCILCHVCSGEHGEAFEARNKADVLAAAARGVWNGWRFVAVQIVDDAHLTGRLQVMPGGRLWIEDPPPRWLVVIGRALAAGTQPDAESVLGAVLDPYIGRANTAAVRAGIERDMTEALQALDDNIVSVEIKTRQHAIERDHLIFEVTSKSASAPMTVTLTPDVEVPASVLSRKPAEA